MQSKTGSIFETGYSIRNFRQFGRGGGVRNLDREAKKIELLRLICMTHRVRSMRLGEHTPIGFVVSLRYRILDWAEYKEKHQCQNLYILRVSPYPIRELRLTKKRPDFPGLSGGRALAANGMRRNGPQGFDAYPAFPFFRRVVAMRSLPVGEPAGELGMIRVVFPAFRSVERHLFRR